MNHPKDVEAAIATEWKQALVHAGLAEADARLWIGSAASRDANVPGAQYLHPYQELPDNHGLTPSQVAEAEVDDCAGLRRVIVYPEVVERHELPAAVEIAALGAMLRHELEHARQQAALGNDFATWMRPSSTTCSA